MEKETEARRILKEKEGRVAIGQPILRRVDRIGYKEAAGDIRQHYQTTGSRELEEAENRLRHLDGFFVGRRIAAIGPDDIMVYAAQRQGESASNGMINRELAVLNKMMRLAYENNKLLRLPVVRKLEEGAPRQGFFERKRFEAVCCHLRPDLYVTILIASTFGWRMQSEVLTLERRQVGLDAGTLRLEPGTTENDEASIGYHTPGLKSILAAQVERVRTLEHRLGRIIPHLFPYLKGRHCGSRIKDFRKA
jgi:hypothetical protein